MPSQFNITLSTQQLHWILVWYYTKIHCTSLITCWVFWHFFYRVHLLWWCLPSEKKLQHIHYDSEQTTHFAITAPPITAVNAHPFRSKCPTHLSHKCPTHLSHKFPTYLSYKCPNGSPQRCMCSDNHNTLRPRQHNSGHQARLLTEYVGISL